MEENKKVDLGKKDTMFRRVAKFFTANQHKILMGSLCTVLAYTGYKAYTSTVYSSDFINSITSENEVEKVIIFGITLAFKKKNESGWYISERSLYDDASLKTLLHNNNVQYACSPIEDVTIGNIIFNIVLPTAITIWAFKKFLMPQIDKTVVDHSPKEVLYFGDIGGNEAAKEALMEIADFINNPDSYRKLGIRLPRGVLLYGPPGTGKTLMAKALAHECQVPFQYASGSDFVELYAGLGPKRVRELFSSARSLGKCIIFIDEIDSLGGERGKGNACKEFDNTLNQLLTEMDGFRSSENITVIAATNQEDHIDQALLRPGRFDRKIKIELPDQNARFEILKIHLAKRTTVISDDLVYVIAEQTPTFTGAELENIVNEACFIWLKRNKISQSPIVSEISYEDLELGLAKVQKERNDIEISKLEKLNKQANDPNMNLLRMLLQPHNPGVINK